MRALGDVETAVLRWLQLPGILGWVMAELCDSAHELLAETKAKGMHLSPQLPLSVNAISMAPPAGCAPRG